jgi:hypothetical protein
MLQKYWDKLDLLKDNKIKLALFIVLPWPISLIIVILYYIKKSKNKYVFFKK